MMTHNIDKIIFSEGGRGSNPTIQAFKSIQLSVIVKCMSKYLFLHGRVTSPPAQSQIWRVAFFKKLNMISKQQYINLYKLLKITILISLLTRRRLWHSEESSPSEQK